MSKWKIPYRHQVPIVTKRGTFNVDFVVGKNCVVECEGAVHSSQIREDNLRANLISDAGFTVMRIPDFQIFGNITECLLRIRACAGSETPQSV